MHKVKNAIILAAGRGSRLLDLTESCPKPLLKPRGVTFLEGIVWNLKEKGINDITVVTGYLAEKFEPYVSKLGIKLVHNSMWDKGNNVTSIKAAIDHIGDSLIVNGDIIMEKNVFETEYPSSLTYVEENENINEWFVNVDANQNVLSFDKNGLGKKGFFQREIIFVTAELANLIKSRIDAFDQNEYQEYLMLETAHANNIHFGIHVIPKEMVYDLDNKDDYLNYKATMLCSIN